MSASSIKVPVKVKKKSNGRSFIERKIALNIKGSMPVDRKENCVMLKTDGKGKKRNNSNKFIY